jgi:hypothetical protein
MSTLRTAAILTLRRAQLARVGWVMSVTLLCVLAAAMLERLAGPGAADRSVTGWGLGVALPLVAYYLSTLTRSGLGLGLALAQYARYGANRRALAVGHMIALALLTGMAGLLIGALAAFGGRGWFDPSLARDVLTSGGAGLVGGACYACLLTLGAGLWRHGALAFLVLDWLVGSGVSLAALTWPRAHLRNLLGGTPVLDWPQWTGLPSLVALSFLALLLAMARVPR